VGAVARGELFPIINCSDIAGMRAFYESVLGGEQVYQFPDEGDAVYLVLRIGTGQVGLGLGTGPALYGDTPLPASGHAVDICVYVGDLPGVVAAAERSGAAVPVRPQLMPWGETVAYIQDPEGTMLLVIQDE
jgi:catechol 2,3-dioxygenase-like lactoylglutathione lyase family enzyme